MKHIFFGSLIFVLVFSCSRNKKEIIYLHFSNNKSSLIFFNMDSLKTTKNKITTDCFLNKISHEEKKYFFQSQDFDWLMDIKLRNIKEARIVFNNQIYYAYEHKSIGLIYLIEFDSKNRNVYYLKSHPDFNEKVVDSLLRICIDYRSRLEQHIFSSDFE